MLVHALLGRRQRLTAAIDLGTNSAFWSDVVVSGYIRANIVNLIGTESPPICSTPESVT